MRCRVVHSTIQEVCLVSLSKFEKCVWSWLQGLFSTVDLPVGRPKQKSLSDFTDLCLKDCTQRRSPLKFLEQGIAHRFCGPISRLEGGIIISNQHEGRRWY